MKTDLTKRSYPQMDTLFGQMSRRRRMIRCGRLADLGRATGSRSVLRFLIGHSAAQIQRDVFIGFRAAQFAGDVVRLIDDGHVDVLVRRRLCIGRHVHVAAARLSLDVEFGRRRRGFGAAGIDALAARPSPG